MSDDPPPDPALDPEAAPEEPAPEPAPEAAPQPVPDGPSGLMELLRPRRTWGQLVGAVLCLLVGFAVVAQVTSTRRDTTFATAREDELVGILADLSHRSERLRGDLRELERTRTDLRRDVRGGTALEEARRRAAAYGVLAGTLPAEGPGIELRIDDPSGVVRAVDLLDALQELRDAGAEVIQINDLRTGVSTHFVDAAGGIRGDGRPLRPPYRFLAIGDPHTMTTALNIPGGVVKSLGNAGARTTVTSRDRVEVNAVRRR